MSIQELCEKISDKIVTELQYDADQKAVIQYGLFAIIQTTLAISTGVLFGALLGVLLPTLVISFVAVILRKYSGGVHAQTPEGCMLVGTIVSVGGALGISWIPWNGVSIIIGGIILFGIAYYVIWKWAPVDSTAKPIRREEKKKLLKKRSILILTLYLIMVIVSLVFYLSNNHKELLLYIASVYVGVGWQVFTLTTTGHLVMGKIDLFFNKITKLVKGGELNEKDK